MHGKILSPQIRGDNLELHLDLLPGQTVLQFNGVFTRQPWLSRFGNDLADLLLGIPFRAQLSTRAQSVLRRRLYHTYAQRVHRIL